MRRTECGSCHSTRLTTFLDLGSSPLADAFPVSPDDPETFYPLQLAVCEECWLVQLMEVVPDDLLYGADYGFYTGASPSSIAYFREYARWAIGRFNPKFVVEIASNDGTLLRDFRRDGTTILGVEPAANVALAAKENDVPTYNRPFGRVVASDIGKGRADLIIANNVIAHVSDLDDFIGGIADLLAPDGTALIEFQYLPDLLVGNQFDHVYHEHRSYFSLHSLQRALAPHGLYIADWLNQPTQGGSVRAVVNRAKWSSWLPEEFVTRADAYAGVQGRIDYVADAIRELVWQRKRVGSVAGYAASAKSTTLLNYCMFDTHDIEYVEDLTPSKIGRYTPGTHIPIRAPLSQRPDTYLLLAWNYLPGILTREAEYRAAGGKFIVPIPQPVLL